MADAQRKLIYVGRLVPGAMHDFTLLKKQIPPNEPWFSGLTVRLDPDFQGFDKTYASGQYFCPPKSRGAGT